MGGNVSTCEDGRTGGCCACPTPPTKVRLQETRSETATRPRSLPEKLPPSLPPPTPTPSSSRRAPPSHSCPAAVPPTTLTPSPTTAVSYAACPPSLPPHVEGPSGREEIDDVSRNKEPEAEVDPPVLGFCAGTSDNENKAVHVEDVTMPQENAKNAAELHAGAIKAEKVDVRVDGNLASADASREFRKALIATIIVLTSLFGSVLIALIVGASADQCSAEALARTDLDICMPCSGGGYVMPLAGDAEQRANWIFRGLVYFFALGWMFAGVGLVCDTFMNAIEKITSTERTVKVTVKGRSHSVRVQVWNPTVANLTLMALGSSAPEILLNTIEVFTGQFFAGELGPATIVGSAAFNLLVISAVCISAIPVHDSRKIDAVDVFGVTCSCSVLAYLWLLLILLSHTPDMVGLWEGLLTFLFFPLLIIIAFVADKGIWPFRRSSKGASNADCTEDAESPFESERRRLSTLTGIDISQEQLDQLAKTADQEDISDMVSSAKPPRTSRLSARKEMLGIVVGAQQHRASSCSQDSRGGRRAESKELEPEESIRSQWVSQFREAFYVHGSADDQLNATMLDWACHCISLCWKIFAAMVPPPAWHGGWVCFFGALVAIGMLTLLVGECAGLLGCSVGIEKETCAITLVALGTSLPDTFASKGAALSDSNADNSIGNITGSNSVNVFLGLGIPWTAAAVYWQMEGANEKWRTRTYKGKLYEDMFLGRYPDGGFVVPAGDGETLLKHVLRRHAK
eukprot:TRINITY_DN15964_c0_g1_i1.p1 TRINITY_DN15964_c0_g1~~TRINITY_DN15964_c0_g1_i1.p1  ORF type:complete len:743 (-),score=100.11 TRINITY_DN15964_c0_g1_i1:33-2261(-)